MDREDCTNPLIRAGIRHRPEGRARKRTSTRSQAGHGNHQSPHFSSTFSFLSLSSTRVASLIIGRHAVGVVARAAAARCTCACRSPTPSFPRSSALSAMRMGTRPLWRNGRNDMRHWAGPFRPTATGSFILRPPRVRIDIDDGDVAVSPIRSRWRKRSLPSAAVFTNDGQYRCATRVERTADKDAQSATCVLLIKQDRAQSAPEDLLAQHTTAAFLDDSSMAARSSSATGLSGACPAPPRPRCASQG